DQSRERTGRELTDVRAMDPDHRLVGLQQTEKAAQQGGLAGAVGPSNAQIIWVSSTTTDTSLRRCPSRG
ncbi:MAG: hypothetical protein ABI873_02270, partial [Marmoricola sp.]